MKLQEYQAKQLLVQYQVPIPRGEVAMSPAEARRVAAALGRPVALKAQVLVGGRGKAGGIQLADTPDAAAAVAASLLQKEIKGLPVRVLLVEEAVPVAQELYLSVMLDRATQRLTMISSAAGGMDIEEVARETPERITRLVVDPDVGLRVYHARHLGAPLDMGGALLAEFSAIAQGLYTVALERDAFLVEINPLARTADGHLLALDAKILVDDNALYRHPDLAALQEVNETDPQERRAREHGLNYVHLNGDIGCMVNGAGLAMATMDIIQAYGSAPANFLDIGGGARAEVVVAGLRVILSDPQVKAVLINIFGGITRCDEVARGIVQALQEIRPTVPLVVRLVGTNEAEGQAILAEQRLLTATTLSEAAQKAVAAARGGLGR